ncbi:MAG: type II secretion system major pseudopilin GspG [Phycisphaerales bacterium]
MHRRPHRPSGFTILELLIVIGILLAIGGLVLMNLVGASEKADKKLAMAQMQAFQKAIDQFRLDMKRLPTQEEGLKVLWTKEGMDETESAKWGGPYLQEPKPKDTWGNDWIYKNPAEIEGVEFDIISIGPDREEGSDDDISLAKERVKNAGGDDAFSDFKPAGSGGSGSGGSSGAGGGGGT